MEAEFWHRRWRAGETGFHKSVVNPLLIRYLPRLALARGARVFVPLCGKTLDIGWLLACGYRVAGVELSETAVRQLFAGLDLTPEISQNGPLARYHAANIDIFVGDVFDLTAAVLGTVDAVYDRAALVALPDAMRRRYTAHLTDIAAHAPQLLLCFEYDQSQMDGPPFSIPPAAVEHHYAGAYMLTLLASQEVAGGLKGLVAATEHAWQLTPNWGQV